MQEALLTDLYELTMLAGYKHEAMHDQPATFELFFRDAPYQGSFAVFAGLQPALDYLSALKFTAEDIHYLDSLNIFDQDFLGYLKDFRFKGKVTAPCEGELVFPGLPLLTVEGTLAEAQLVETALLNIINFQTLVATKAARLSFAAGKSQIMEFGLRRAQGPDGGMSVARAAAIGGIRSTSNVLAGRQFGLPVKGTHAHSWVMSFPDELTAFRAFAKSFPDHCILLVDTYDTLSSGVPNSIKVAEELRAAGHELVGIRLDSGDLAYLSREARRMLDAAGFPEVKIVASNELDEFVISSIRNEGGCIDIYGVGTRLATCAGPGGGALGGVYKLVEYAGHPRMKFTSDPVKSTLPAGKRWLRAVDKEDTFVLDLLDLKSGNSSPAKAGDIVYDPANPQRHKAVPKDCRLVECHQTVMENGEILVRETSLDEMADYREQQMQHMPQGCLRLTNPHSYKVAVTEQLLKLKADLLKRNVR